MFSTEPKHLEQAPKMANTCENARNRGKRQLNLPRALARFPRPIGSLPSSPKHVEQAPKIANTCENARNRGKRPLNLPPAKTRGTSPKNRPHMRKCAKPRETAAESPARP